jgi:predicted DNA-binding transcriptional regulator YafY
MAKPLARVLALLDILQMGGTRTQRELSQRLGVDERTVRRYVDHLVDLDVPVESVRGRYGGYRLAPGYRMPPLMLTDAEAVAVLLGLTGVRRAALDPDAAVAVESAEAKVRRVLPRPLAARLSALSAATSYSGDSRSPVTPETGILLAVAGAAVRRQPLAILYTSPSCTPTGTTGPPSGCCSHTALSPSRGGGTPPAWTRAAARCAPSGWTGSPALPSRTGSSRYQRGSTRRAW